MNPQTPTATVPTPADQYATLKSAVLGAQVNTAPGASPLGSFPELSKLYSTAPELSKIQLNSAAPNYNAGVDAAAEDAQRKADASAAAQKLKDEQDPSKYKQVQTDDGGYKFYDPLGNEISASQFAAVNNTTPNEILKHSQNPIDVAFQQDFNQLQGYIRNKANSAKDPAAKSAAQAVETQVRKLYGIDLHQQNPAQVIAAFQAAYPTIYGGTTAGKQGTSTLLPSPAALKANAKGSVSSGAL